ncbi:ras family domain-containing protein [Ditylenchus destructor]|nr:ras family domain-containing protein [Ditylenchus destructor]
MSSYSTASTSAKSAQSSTTMRKRNRKQKPFTAKVVVVGNMGVGKTSILMRHDGQGFTTQMSSTMGASFVSSKSIHNGREVHLQIWDTAGQERFRSMTHMYLRNTMACILIYDITDRDSFVDLNYWVKEIERADCGPVALFIFGNKLDLAERRSVTETEARAFAEHHNAQFFETSALRDRGIETAMNSIAETILSRIVTHAYQNQQYGISLQTVPGGSKGGPMGDFVVDEGSTSSGKSKDEGSRKCCVIM